MDEQKAVTAVTLTVGANQDLLSEEDYREIYDEVRGFNEETGAYRVSLDAFVAAIGSQFSKALWSKYHNGAAALNRTMRSELRRAVGLEALPPTVGEAVAGVDPDAEVVQIGEEQARRVLLVGHAGPLVIRVNGSVTAEEMERTERVTPVTEAGRARRALVRPVAQVEQERRRVAVGASWREVIEAGLAVLETAAQIEDEER